VHLAFTPHDIGVTDPSQWRYSAAFGPKIKIIENRASNVGWKLSDSFSYSSQMTKLRFRAPRQSDRAGWSSWTAFEATQRS
jgi:hypothetical protein